MLSLRGAKTLSYNFPTNPIRRPTVHHRHGYADRRTDGGKTIAIPRRSTKKNKKTGFCQPCRRTAKRRAIFNASCEIHGQQSLALRRLMGSREVPVTAQSAGKSEA